MTRECFANLLTSLFLVIGLMLAPISQTAYATDSSVGEPSSSELDQESGGGGRDIPDAEHGGSGASFADSIIVKEPTNDTDEIYSRYQNNSFELMTKKFESLSEIKKGVVNVGTSFKEIMWAGVVWTGKMNVTAVSFLFSIDIISPLLSPIKNMTSAMASSMLGIAGSLGITFVAFVMAFKALRRDRVMQVLKVLAMTFTLFFGLVIMKDANKENSIIDFTLQIDQTVELAILQVNPKFDTSKEESKSTDSNVKVSETAERIASEVFRSNIYEPYLLMQYGTSDSETIRKEKVEYDGKKYDRIGLLLDNEVNSEDSGKMYDTVSDYEVDTLENYHILYNNSWSQGFIALFFTIINIIQTVIYFILAFLRGVMSLLLLVIFPLGAIVLFAGLFAQRQNMLANFGKGAGTIILTKGMISFAVIFFANYVTIGYSAASQLTKPLEKILLIVFYICLPMGIYFFRYFLTGMFTGRVNVGEFLSNPMRTNRLMRQAGRDRSRAEKERRKHLRAKRKALAEQRKKKGTGGENNPKEPNTQHPNQSESRNADLQGGVNRRPINAPQTESDYDQITNAPLSGQEELNVSEARQARSSAEVKQANNQVPLTRSQQTSQAQSQGQTRAKDSKQQTSQAQSQGQTSQAELKQQKRQANRWSKERSPNGKELLKKVDNIEADQRRPKDQRFEMRQASQSRQALYRHKRPNEQAYSKQPHQSVTIPRNVTTGKREPLQLPSKSVAHIREFSNRSPRIIRENSPYERSKQVPSISANKLPAHVKQAQKDFAELRDKKAPNARRYRSVSVPPAHIQGNEMSERRPTIRRETKPPTQ